MANQQQTTPVPANRATNIESDKTVFTPLSQSRPPSKMKAPLGPAIFIKPNLPSKKKFQMDAPSQEEQ
jgi:hypothetical protein